MVIISVNNKEMILTVLGLHKLWALKSEMIIPLEQIAGAVINHQRLVKPEGWRAPGTSIPGLITAGIYRAHGDKVFWDVVDANKSIIIQLQHNEYKELIVEVENPAATVEEINGMISVRRANRNERKIYEERFSKQD